MSEPQMIERVAKAICEAEGLRWEDQGDPLRSGSGNDDTEHYRHIARAAIEAMREPTSGMLNAPLPPGSSSSVARFESRRDLRPLIFRTMIDAALAEPTAPR